jgi:hypothetical protein
MQAQRLQIIAGSYALNKSRPSKASAMTEILILGLNLLT